MRAHEFDANDVTGQLLPEPVIDPDAPICDAHHHLWDRPGQRYLLPEFAADAESGHNVTSTVYVEWRSHYRTTGPELMRPVGETEFATAVADRAAKAATRVCTAIVGYADLSAGGSVGRVLEAHVDAGKGRFRGIRNVGIWDPDPDVLGGPAICGPGLYLDPGFRKGFALLREFDLTFDAWVFQTQLPDLINLARSFPEQPIVLNHSGGVLGVGRYSAQRQVLFSSWRHLIQELARCPNVAIKLGGLGMRRSGFKFFGEPERTSSLALATAWQPWIETCIEEFGVRRCMFESNFPVDGASASYVVLWNAFKRIAASGTALERTYLFRESAAKFYRIT